MTDYQKAFAALLAEAGSQRVIVVRRISIDVVGTLEGAVLLEQCLFWASRSAVKPAGTFAKSYNDLTQELGVSRRELDQARAKLAELGFVSTELRKFGGAPTLHWTIHLPAVLDGFAKHLEQSNLDLSDMANGFARNSKTIDLPDVANPLTYTIPQAQVSPVEPATRASYGSIGANLEGEPKRAKRTTKANAPEPMDKLQGAQRAYAVPFEQITGIKLTSGQEGLWRKAINQWQASGIQPNEIGPCVAYMRKQGLLIASPASLTKVLISLHADGRTADPLADYPVYTRGTNGR